MTSGFWGVVNIGDKVTDVTGVIYSHKREKIKVSGTYPVLSITFWINIMEGGRYLIYLILMHFFVKKIFAFLNISLNL